MTGSILRPGYGVKTGPTASAVSVQGVSKSFRIYHDRNQSLKAAVLRRKRATFEEFWALRDVSLEIPEGKTFGLMGHNGSGKSTLLKCIAKILQPNEGSITSRGRMAAMLEVGSGFHPELSGKENVYLNGSILGMSKQEIDGKFDTIVDFAGVGDFIDQPVKNYSSGMYVRLGFSVAIHVEPDILLVDEILAVGDMQFQEKCREKFAEFKDEGRTVIVVSHGLGEMRTLCDEAAWLDHGKLVEVGSGRGDRRQLHRGRAPGPAGRLRRHPARQRRDHRRPDRTVRPGRRGHPPVRHRRPGHGAAALRREHPRRTTGFRGVAAFPGRSASVVASHLGRRVHSASVGRQGVRRPGDPSASAGARNLHPATRRWSMNR